MKLSKIKGFEHITNFDLREFVHPNVWERFGANCIWFLDPNLYTIAQLLRDRFGPTTINSWHYGGSRINSGFNPDRPIGAQYSQHKYGRAIDCQFSNATPNEVRAEMLNQQELWIDAGVTTIEHERFAPTWVHIDTRFTNLSEILIVKP